MEIFLDTLDKYYAVNSRLVHNCVTIKNEETIYHYEFLLNYNKAIIKTDAIDYILEATEFYYRTNPFVTTYISQDNSFYQSYDEPQVFKLPIQCLQPSKLFLNKKRLEELEQLLDLDQIALPVAIIDDEYVLLDGHHRLYLLKKNDYKMVNVFISSYDDKVHDFIYLAKESNFTTIDKINVLSDEDYNKYWIQFEEVLK